MDDFTPAAQALAADGWCVLPQLLPPEQTAVLRAECAALDAAHAFRRARTGLERTASMLRTDRTHWFAPDALSAPQRAYLRRLNALRIALNRNLMLGLVDCEAHYAVYPVGGGYARHRDCMHYSEARVVSAVYYLNEDWQPDDGGALRLYLPDGAHHDIVPTGGTLALFLSAQFEHEVLPAKRERTSIACWLRQRQAPEQPTC
ncbi:MAG: 2OG-Fe(II) oxygenase [Rhodanobacter sp.]